MIWKGGSESIIQNKIDSWFDGVNKCDVTYHLVISRREVEGRITTIQDPCPSLIPPISKSSMISLLLHAILFDGMTSSQLL